MHVSGYGGSDGDKRFTIDKLKNEEEQTLHKMMSGTEWVRRAEDGSLQSTPAYNGLPKPADDPEMTPFWLELSKSGPTQIEFKGFFPTGNSFSPSIYITSLCGYYYSAENYKIEVERLESYGFECMRSRRGTEGKFWEVWYLPLWRAEGDLRSAIENKKCICGHKKHEHDFVLECCTTCDRGLVYKHCDKYEEVQSKAGKSDRTKLKDAISFLCRNARFGSLEVTFQKAAMVID